MRSTFGKDLNINTQFGKAAFSPDPELFDLKRTALLLDVDGTLLDIAATPNGVVVPPRLPGLLRNLLRMCDGALALVSGRTIASLDRLFLPVRTPAIGGHGVEIRTAGERPVVKRFAVPLSPNLRGDLHRLAAEDPRLFVEDKIYAIAVHYRLVPDREAFLKDKTAELLARSGVAELEILEGRAVLEIKPRHVSKGLAVKELMMGEPFAGRVPLFFGDDKTDESVFAVLPDFGGCGYAVGRPLSGARGTLGTPQEVRSWLTSLAGESARTP